MRLTIPAEWNTKLQDFIHSESFRKLEFFLSEENRLGRTPFPAPENIFRALALVPPSQVRVVILGQDPYHGEGQAIGLSFAVPNHLMPKPPSLRNIFKELASDLGVHPKAQESDLLGWADQGVLLLNTVLTVRAHEPLSHQNQGWEEFTDGVLCQLNQQPQGIVFVLWGSSAQKKKKLITSDRHCVIESAHPSPLSAYRGFFGSRVFSRINGALMSLGHPAVDWTRVTRP